MPSVSKKQFRYFEALQHGGIKNPTMSKKKAEEFTHGVDYKSLPESAPKFKKVRSMMGKK